MITFESFQYFRRWIHNENTVLIENKVIDTKIMIRLIMDIVGIVVGVIGIIVTSINILQSTKKDKHQKNPNVRIFLKPNI